MRTADMDPIQASGQKRTDIAGVSRPIAQNHGLGLEISGYTSRAS